MVFFVAIGVRGGLGFLFGVLFGIFGLIVTQWVIPGNWAPPMWMIVVVAAVSASSAGFLAWFKPESRWRVAAVGLGLALVGGIAGAWIGYWYSEIVYPEGVRNPQLVATTVRSTPVMPFVTFAAMFSTALGAVYYAFRLWRYNED